MEQKTKAFREKEALETKLEELQTQLKTSKKSEEDTKSELEKLKERHSAQVKELSSKIAEKF